MAKGRISEDKLRYTIDVNSSKAQQEVHKLERELSVLNAESRSYVRECRYILRLFITIYFSM